MLVWNVREKSVILGYLFLWFFGSLLKADVVSRFDMCGTCVLSVFGRIPGATFYLGGCSSEED